MRTSPVRSPVRSAWASVVCVCCVAAHTGCSSARLDAPRAVAITADGPATIATRNVLLADLYIAEAELSDGQRVSLVVDTGSPYALLLDPEVHEHLSPGERRKARIDSVTLDGLRLDGVPFVVASLAPLRDARPLRIGDQTISPKLDGALGLKAFPGQRVVFDIAPFPRGAVRVVEETEPLGEDAVAYRVGERGYPWVEARVAGQRREFVLDTGNPGGVSFDDAEGLPLVGGVSEDQDVRFTMLGEHASRTATLDGDVRLGPVVRERPSTRIDGPGFPPPLLGLEFFAGYRLTFDHASRRVLIERLPPLEDTSGR